MKNVDYVSSPLEYYLQPDKKEKWHPKGDCLSLSRACNKLNHEIGRVLILLQQYTWVTLGSDEMQCD